MGEGGSGVPASPVGSRGSRREGGGELPENLRKPTKSQRTAMIKTTPKSWRFGSDGIFFKVFMKVWTFFFLKFSKEIILDFSPLVSCRVAVSWYLTAHNKEGCLFLAIGSRKSRIFICLRCRIFSNFQMRHLYYLTNSNSDAQCLFWDGEQFLNSKRVTHWSRRGKWRRMQQNRRTASCIQTIENEWMNKQANIYC